MKSKKTIKISIIIIAILALCWLVITGLPFYYMIMTSLRSSTDIFKNGTFAFPEKFMFSNYANAIKNNLFLYFKNSIVIVGASLFFILMSSSFAAYPLSRFKFPLNKPIFSLIIACMGIPIHATLIPIYLLSQNIGIYGNLWALLGPYVAFNIPISVFILSGFMREMPIELEEAAEIDGCNKFTTFFKIIFPLSKPGLATLFIYNGVNLWNEFSFALVLTQREQNRTLPLSIWEYQGQYATDTPMILTILTLCAIPMIIVFILGQDKLIKGMMAGAVKG